MASLYGAMSYGRSRKTDDHRCSSSTNGVAGGGNSSTKYVPATPGWTAWRSTWIVMFGLAAIVARWRSCRAITARPPTGLSSATSSKTISSLGGTGRDRMTWRLIRAATRCSISDSGTPVPTITARAYSAVWSRPDIRIGQTSVGLVAWDSKAASATNWLGRPEEPVSNQPGRPISRARPDGAVGLGAGDLVQHQQGGDLLAGDLAQAVLDPVDGGRGQTSTVGDLPGGQIDPAA